jgi:hypothetical protein
MLGIGYGAITTVTADGLGAAGAGTLGAAAIGVSGAAATGAEPLAATGGEPPAAPGAEPLATPESGGVELPPGTLLLDGGGVAPAPPLGVELLPAGMIPPVTITVPPLGAGGVAGGCGAGDWPDGVGLQV